MRPADRIEQSLSRTISPEERRAFLAAVREAVERSAVRYARLNPRRAQGEVAPYTLKTSALRDKDGKVIGVMGILHDMPEYEQAVRDLKKSKSELQEKILDLAKFEEMVVGRELKMMALEKELERLRKEVERPNIGEADRERGTSEQGSSAGSSGAGESPGDAEPVSHASRDT